MAAICGCNHASLCFRFCLNLFVVCKSFDWDNEPLVLSVSGAETVSEAVVNSFRENLQSGKVSAPIVLRFVRCLCVICVKNRFAFVQRARCFLVLDAIHLCQRVAPLSRSRQVDFLFSVLVFVFSQAFVLADLRLLPRCKT